MAGNEEQQFLQAYDELADSLFRHCFFRLFDRDKAKDAVQETFLRAWKYIAAGGRVKHMKSFLFRTAGNIIIDEARKAKHRQHPSLDELTETGLEPGHTPTPDLHNKIEADRVLALCRDLPDDYREVLLLRYVEQMTPADIARATGSTANRVSVRLHRAVKQLQSLLPHTYEQ